jgi:predicted nucleotidyltransferase
MKSISTIEKSLLKSKPMLSRRYGVTQIGIFGSYIRGTAKRKSDLDLLVDFGRPISLIGFVQLKNDLSDRLGVPVDLVMKRALKPGIGKSVLKEVRYV